MAPREMYCHQLGVEITDAIQNSADSLEKICAAGKDECFPHPRTIRGWLTNNTYPEFTEMYMRAKANQAFYIVDKMLDIVNDAQPDKFGRVEKANLQIRTYQWIASKLKCKAFGDKPEVKDELPPDTLTDSEKLDKILSTVSAGLKRKNASSKK
mgnify:CR=1 FL=1